MLFKPRPAAIVAALFAVTIATQAHAQYRDDRVPLAYLVTEPDQSAPTRTSRQTTRHVRREAASRRYSLARPRAWCGWWLRQHVPHDPGPAFNLARNWARYGTRANGPCVNCIAVRWHHVEKVTAVLGGGRYRSISGNVRGAVREMERSTRGVIAWRA